MRQGVIGDPVEVEELLSMLGLKAAQLWDALMMGEAARKTCTANDPAGFPGLMAHARTVRGLREILLPLGWKRNGQKNFATVVSPDESFRVAVATGDNNVGDPRVEPKTKNVKGSVMEDAVAVNASQGELFPELVIAAATHQEDGPLDVPVRDDCKTWILLFRRTEKGEDVTAELSLPSALGDDMRVDAWTTRILLGSMPGDPGARIPNVESGPELDIAVVRR